VNDGPLDGDDRCRGKVNRQRHLSLTRVTGTQNGRHEDGRKNCERLWCFDHSDDSGVLKENETLFRLRPDIVVCRKPVANKSGQKWNSRRLGTTMERSFSPANGHSARQGCGQTKIHILKPNPNSATVKTWSTDESEHGARGPSLFYNGTNQPLIGNRLVAQGLTRSS
jgi:hypothetical protein